MQRRPVQRTSLFLRRDLFMPQFVWNPWHGCHKYSAGCQNCYVYRRDSSIGKDASEITKNRDFDLPIRQARNGSYKIPDGSTIFTCMTSDFFTKKPMNARPALGHDPTKTRCGVYHHNQTHRTIQRMYACKLG